MEVKKFFDRLRKIYLSNLKSDENKKEEEKIERIDNFVSDILRKNKNFLYVLNNKLSCYLVYFTESGILNNSIDKRIETNAYSRFEKITNTIEILNSFGKNHNCKILLIKSMNIIPYLPVNDIDIMVDNPSVVKSFEEYAEYQKANEFEKNKFNFLPKNPKKYFKISFHEDLTWDNEKIIDFKKEEIWNGCYQISSHIYVNSPEVEATIKLEECLLENLHLKLIDHLYIKNYLSKNYIHLITNSQDNTFPHFIKFSDLIKYNRNKLFLKNLRRFFIFKAYWRLTGKIPLRERYEETNLNYSSDAPK